MMLTPQCHDDSYSELDASQVYQEFHTINLDANQVLHAHCTCITIPVN